MAEATKLERLLSVLLTVATVAVAIVVVEGRLRPRNVVRGGDERVVEVRDWRRQSAGAELALGDTAGVVRIAVFTDFECPFCKRLDAALARLEVKYPGKIARTIVHYPLPQHRFAVSAAVGAECASEQGRGRQMNDVLFASQDSFGLRTWTSLATDAGVADLAKFEVCVGREQPHARIKTGADLAATLKLSGTPAVVINGWLFDPASPASVEKAVQAIVAGGSPIPVGAR